jgi:hypothetical protein
VKSKFDADWVPQDLVSPLQDALKGNRELCGRVTICLVAIGESEQREGRRRREVPCRSK